MNLRTRKDEKGIALLFTLGMLAVLLVIALAFATTSITERKAAANNAEVTSARLLAESAVQRAISGLRYSDALTPTAAYDKMFSHEPSATSSEPYLKNKESFDTLWRLTTVKDNVNYYTWLPSDYYPATANAVHWQYIHDPTIIPPATVSDNRIIGRIAYFVTGSGGKLDPSMCVSHEKNLGPPATTDANGLTLNAAAGVSYPLGTAADESTIIEERNGKYVCEINVKNLDNNVSGYLDAVTIKKMSTTTIGGGLLPDRANWNALGGFDTFVNAFSSPTLSNNQKAKFKDWFIVSPSSRDEERFWIDSNINGLQDVGEWYHRFNIARTDWNTNVALSGTAGVATLTGAATSYVSGVFTEDGTNGTNAIQWLTKFGKNSATGIDDNIPYKGTFTNVEARRKQIAANLIDYCDSDTKATTDDEVNPTYTGNDRTPYINEIRFNFDAKITETNIGGGNSKYEPIVRLRDVNVELCDMYGVTLGTTYHAQIFLEGSYDWGPPAADATGPPAANTTVTFGSPTTSITTVDISTNGSKDYLLGLESCNVQLPTVVAPAVAPTVTLAENSTDKFVKNLKITTLKVKIVGSNRILVGAAYTYTGADVFADFSYIEPKLIVNTYDVSTDGTSMHRRISYQVDDPRQNLFAADWFAPVDSNTTTCGTLNAKNTECKPNPGVNKDLEKPVLPITAITQEPWHVSTAFIRNAPMQSPWELGFIHRGAAWETINLKKYNKDDNNDGTEAATEFGVTPNMGGRAYEKGDANILDQIKMTHDTDQGYGKINIRANSVDSLRALIGYIKYGSTFPAASYSTAMPGANGTILDYDTISVTDPSTKALDKIANIINGSDKRPFITRAQIANVSELTDGAQIPQDTDAKKEEIIGKFINLTKSTIADEFTIIAIAQTIKDIGGISGATITIRKDINGDGDVLDTNLDGTSADPGYFWNGTAKTYAASVSSSNLVNETINCIIGQYDLGADEILSEQKILCVVRKSATGKWEIVRYEYVE
jgi:Flp pilus assembly protein TadG